jgi:hypothetical protein
MASPASGKKRGMSVETAHKLFSTCGLLLNPNFQTILEGSGYVLDELAVESMRAEAALVIAKDVVKEAGYKFDKVLKGGPAPETPIDTLEA